MTRKKTLKDFGVEDLQHELDARWAAEHYRADMTMSQMELLIWEHVGMESPAALRHLKVLLARMPLEKPTAKLCPKCGKRAAVKAKDRERSLRTMAGTLMLRRNYHYCEGCGAGFYPLDRTLDLPDEGELTHEMQKRVTDFAVNDVYGQGAARWSLHYREPVSDNLLRRVAARVGALCETVDQGHLQEALKPAAEKATDVLVVQMDGSMLPIVGEEPWKEAKVAVTYHHDTQKRRPVRGSARYAAVVGTLANFAPVLEELLAVERIADVATVIWLGDGALHNWTAADQIAPDAVQILDWYHAVEHAMACGRVLLGEEDEGLPLWHRRAEQLLAAGNAEAFISELMDCLPLLERRRGAARRDALEALDGLVRYYRTNALRMRYSLFREHGFPIGSGAVESAHKHVLQCRMKRAGQRWKLGNARRMAALRAAYRTGGAEHFYDAIQRARCDTERSRPKRQALRHGFRFARYGGRDRQRAAESSSG